MKKYVEIIGPCSKYIDGKGWVTQIPEELLFAKGYVNLLEMMKKDNQNLNIETKQKKGPTAYDCNQCYYANGEPTEEDCKKCKGE